MKVNFTIKGKFNKSPERFRFSQGFLNFQCASFLKGKQVSWKDFP